MTDDKDIAALLDEAIAPYGRLSTALEAFDIRTGEVLAIHAAVEREIDLALARALPHPKRLKNLGFGQKLGILAAASAVEEGLINRWLRPALALNDLRNSVAHGDSAHKITQAVEKLNAAFQVKSDRTLRDAGGSIMIAIHLLSGPSTPLQDEFLARWNAEHP